MTDDRKTKRSGLINEVFGFFINTIFIVFMSLILSIVIEWLGIYFNWWTDGSKHSLEMLRIELMYANPVVESAIINENSSGWIGYIMGHYKNAIHLIFYWNSQAFTYITNQADLISMYSDAGYNIAMVFVLRLFLVVFFVPLFVMIFIWGAVDGLVERDLRRFGAGRESSTIFEAARKLSFPLLVLPFVLYLSYPTSINPLYIITPSALFQAFLYRMLFSKYKKYL